MRHIAVPVGCLIVAAIALLAANAGALAQAPREGPFSEDTQVSTLLRDGWEIKAITASPDPAHEPVIVLQKGTRAAWCDISYEDIPPPNTAMGKATGTPPRALPRLETDFCREIQ
jgi:hypothetical protein